MEFDHQTNVSIPSKRAKNMVQYSTSSKDMVSPPLIKINRVVVNSCHQILIRSPIKPSLPSLRESNSPLHARFDVALKALIPMKGSTIDVSFNCDGQNSG
ncbi:unnamed protein product [Brassica rapa]|uniref:Uncharacterized protein n=2 Tax=Brassica TaxID=3705 RepID=A0A8D9HQZ5_BRACM|nr:unnamed protein product [Brassica napus]CAG7903815.1 unnamed protein product [Brassica rapa]